MDPSPQKRNTDSPEQRAFELRKRAFNLIHSYIERRWKESAKDKKTFVGKIIEDDIKLIPKATEKIKNTFGIFENYSGAEDILMNEMTEATIQIMVEHLSLEEIEEVHRVRSTQERGDQMLSRGLNFSVNGDGSKISLHVPITFFKTPSDALDSYRVGLGVLANKILSDLELKNVQEVIALSSLVQDNPRLLKKFGFDVTLDTEGKPTTEAKMSREKLLELYGPQSVS